MSNVLKADDKVNADELAKTFGVSKTPLREALKSLEKTSLVDFTPYAGYSVKRITAEDIKGLYEIRILLEAFAVDRIIKCVTDKHVERLSRIQEYIEANLSVPKIDLFKMNRQFHDYFYSISGFSKLCEMIGLLWDNLSFFRMLLIQEQDYIENMKREHWDYIKALEKGDGEYLKQLIISNLRKHANRVPDLVREHYK